MNKTRFFLNSKMISTQCILLLLMLFSFSLEAQKTEQDSTLWKLVTNDDNVYLGEIVEENDSLLIFEERKLGVLKIAQNDIKRLEKIEQKKMKKGELWADNPQATRYFFAPNGYGLKKGEGYYQNVMLLFNQVSYGFTDNFSIGLGTFPTFLISTDAPVPIWVTPKVSIPIIKDKFNLGAGVLAGTVLAGDGGFVGIAYGTATMGSRNMNLSVGLGYGFAGDDWSDIPTISLGGMVRVSKKTYLVTDNYILGEGLGLLTLGFRTVWKGASLDYGVVRFVSDDNFAGSFGLPWVGVVVPFYSKRKR